MLIVSNRLPFSIDAGDPVTIHPSSGGLITAVHALLAGSSGAWLGWPGTDESEAVNEALAAYSRDGGFSYEPVFLTEQQRDRFYRGSGLVLHRDE